MRLSFWFLCTVGVALSKGSQISEISEIGREDTKNVPTNQIVEKVDSLKAPGHTIPDFKPQVPVKLLKLEPVVSVRISGTAPLKVFDGTEYGESKEHLGPRSKHFLRKADAPVVIDKDRKTVHSSLDVDESDMELSQAFQDTIDGLKESVDYVVSAIETLPTHPAIKEAETHVDNWAQETRAGFMGYWERLEGLWKKESKSVGKKLFEAADAYSHRFFNLLHVQETDHPVLAAKVTRIIVAMGLSLTLVFVIFGLALQLQKSIIAKAHEEASKRPEDNREQLFFAMPYPPTTGTASSNIVVVQ